MFRQKGFRKYLFLIKVSKSMGKLRNDFNAFREQQDKLNQSLIKQLQSIKVQNESAMGQRHQCIENTSATAKIRLIFAKLTSFNERIRALEALNQEPKNNRWERVKGITNKFATSTSVYGINRMVKAKSIPMRIVWTLMALASVSLGFIIIGNTIVNFFKFDVFTQTKLLNPEPNSSFMPSVTFCTESDDNPNNLIIEANFIDKLGTERSVNLSGVSFYDQNLDSYYRCLRFNHYQENKTGYHKLFPIKYINSQHFTFKINLTANFTDVSILMSDNYIQILDWSQLVTTFGNDQRGYIDIGFTKKIDRKLGEPYNKCQVTLESTYRQVNCIAKCRNRDFGRKYNCTLRNFYGDSSYDFCQNGIYFSAEFDADCEKECPKECITTEFDVITNYYVSTASANDSLHIEVSYLDLRFLEISQTPKMSEYSLINEIGGALSLFVGVTFLSLLEFLEYFFEVCLVLYRC